MYEYFDEKLGKIKLVNVTEARANFAKLLSDESHYYVITKNNKPQRVVVSYAEFCQLRQVASDDLALPQAMQKQASLDATHDIRSSVKSAHKTPSRVQGLLQQHLGTSEEAPARAGLPLPRPQPNPNPTPVPQKEVVPVKPEDDYFSTQDADFDLSGDELLEAEVVVPTPSDDDATVLAEIRNSLAIAEECRPETENSAAVTLLQEEYDTMPKEEQVVKTNDDVMTAEEREYYNKYRKLYERPVGEAPVFSTEPQVILENQKQREVKTIVDSLPDLANSADEVARHFSNQPKAERAESTASASVVKAEPLTKTFFVPQSHSEEKSDLPSLQELLRGLDPDADRAAANLSENEIDQIVKQIRQEE